MRYLKIFPVVLILCSTWWVTDVAADHKKNHPNITEVFVDVGVGEVEIIGTNFGISSSVSLGEFGLLNVTLATDVKILADLPVGILPGDYLLKVFRNKKNKKNKTALYDLTVGSVGPPGVAGPVGSQGVPGADGAPGVPGTQGELGPQGVAGPVGPQGTIGLTGPVGPQGPVGADGSTWVTGTEPPTSGQGNVGDLYLESDTGEYFEKTDATTWTLVGNLQGAVGQSGVAGPVGPQGPSGVNGAPGLKGAQGEPGPQGVAGPVGPQGTIGLTGPVGLQGLAGTDGSTWLTGTVPPTSGQGTVGDLYLESDTGEYFEKTDATTWTPVGNLQGAVGSPGVAGPVGSQGPSGVNGAPGPQGVAGAIGPVGPQGLQGVAGPVGPQGPPGFGDGVTFIFESKTERTLVTGAPPANTATVAVTCPASRPIVMGGECVNPLPLRFVETNSNPILSNPQGWTCTFFNPPGLSFNVDITAKAVCRP